MRAVYTSEFCSLEVDREKRRQWRRLQIQLIRRRRRRRRRLLLLHVAATRINDNLLFSLNQPSFPKLSRLPTRFHDKTIVDCRIDALLITHSTTSMHCKEYLIEKSGRKQKKGFLKTLDEKRQLDYLTKLFLCFIELLMPVNIFGQRKDWWQSRRELQL